MKQQQALFLVIRYFLLIILALGNLYLIYLIFTPLTVYPVYFLLSLFFNTAISSNIITLENISIELIPACIAGAAYYLLFILNLLTHMKIKTRIYSLLFITLSFLALNILRIFIFSILALNGSKYFEVTHLFFWYIGSTIILVLVWFVNIIIFKIKEIPFYTDMKSLIKDVKNHTY